MRIQVKLPELGDDADQEANVSFFFPEVNDVIKEGDDLVEMVTDKATFNVPSQVTGKVVEIVVNEDQVVKVGEVLAVIETED